MFQNLLNTDTGTKIKNERERLGMSVQNLAHLSVTTKKNIVKIESKNYEELDFLLLIRISKIIGLNVFSFLKSGVTIEELLKVI